MLSPRLIAETAELLEKRVEERFPGAGLAGVAGDVAALARSSGPKSSGLCKPLWPLRAAVWALGVLAAVVLGYAFRQARLAEPTAGSSLADLLQGADAAANLVLLISAAIYSLWKMEERLRRRRALALVHELRELAHVIDMHQLTKDPATLNGPARTSSSPRRAMTPAQLGRYLDYCSECLALLGKIAAVYAQHVDDAAVLDAVDEIEALTTGLSRKIWQKIAILQKLGPG
jgi:hypothetical protein